MTLDQFFRRYAGLSLGAEPEPFAKLYAPSFIVGGPHGSHAFANDARFIEWLRQLADFNREHGMRSLAAVSVRETPLSPRHALATVTWDAHFEKTGERRIEFDISYLLERTKDAWCVLGYVSRADQKPR